MMISLCRQLIFVLPVAWVFARIASGNGMIWLVWLTFPIAEIISAAIACVLMRRIYKKEIKTLPE